MSTIYLFFFLFLYYSFFYYCILKAKPTLAKQNFKSFSCSQTSLQKMSGNKKILVKRSTSLQLTDKENDFDLPFS